MAREQFTVVFTDGGESPLMFDPSGDDDLWIAVAEQFPRDDPTVDIEYVVDPEGNEVLY